MSESLGSIRTCQGLSAEKQGEILVFTYVCACWEKLTGEMIINM
jgi:hypothetical protein